MISREKLEYAAKWVAFHMDAPKYYLMAFCYAVKMGLQLCTVDTYRWRVQRWHEENCEQCQRNEKTAKDLIAAGVPAPVVATLKALAQSGVKLDDAVKAKLPMDSVTPAQMADLAHGKHAQPGNVGMFAEKPLKKEYVQ